MADVERGALDFDRCSSNLLEATRVAQGAITLLAHIANDQECATLTQGAEPRQDPLATSDHFTGIFVSVLWLNVVDKGVDRLRQVIEGANVCVCACGRLRGEVRSCRGIVIASLGLHDVGDESVLAVPDEL